MICWLTHTCNQRHNKMATATKLLNDQVHITPCSHSETLTPLTSRFSVMPLQREPEKRHTTKPYECRGPATFLYLGEGDLPPSNHFQLNRWKSSRLAQSTFQRRPSIRKPSAQQVIHGGVSQTINKAGKASRSLQQVTTDHVGC